MFQLATFKVSNVIGLLTSVAVDVIFPWSLAAFGAPQADNARSVTRAPNFRKGFVFIITCCVEL